MRMRRCRQRSRTRPDCSCCRAGRKPLHRPGADHIADALQSALTNPGGATASGTVDVNDERGDEPAGRPQLRAI